jgi:putative ABC transport system ATP-binding protein
MTETITPSSVDVAARAIDASKIYGSGEAEVRALNGINVQFQTSRLTAIMGPSGSGKSTLLHCMAGLDRLSSGQIFLGDVEISRANEKELTLIRRDKLGFIFQAYNLIPTLNALENMTLPMSLAGNKPDPAWLETIVETVRLKDRLTHRPAELSGGQQQRVAVGRALLSKPSIIFADEPTGNLDSRSGAEILTFMRKAVDDLGQTIVMVTHDPIAAGYADRVVFLADGSIVDELLAPNADSVLDKMKSLGG